MSNISAHNYFASCPKGLENLLKQELEALGSSEVRETVAGVYFNGTLETAYKACLWSRLANKILMPLAKGGVEKAEDLYELVKAQAWEEHLPEHGSLLVEFLGTNDAIRHTQFGAQTVKDGVVDRLRDKFGSRPDVKKYQPDLLINARLSKNVAHLSIDLSGSSLHRRGYRLGQGGAPLKENLAAAILLRAGWPTIADGGGALLDPMCGSGTLLIEAAMIATDMAPGLLRARASSGLHANSSGDMQPTVNGFGFETWRKHQRDVWRTVVAEAETRFQVGIDKSISEIRGYDVNPRVLGSTRKNITLAGLDDFIRVTEKDVADFKKPTHKDLSNGLIICNPPYGERLGEIEELRDTYLSLAAACKREFVGWQLGVFTGNKELGREMRLRPKKKYQLFNGTIPSELLLYDLLEEGSVARKEDAERALRQQKRKDEVGVPKHLRELSDGATMVANRLRKNNKKLGKWLKQQNISAYRVYDADMPEYSAAVDVYCTDQGTTLLHIQEYAAPKTIDEQKAQQRFEDLVHACAQVFGCTEQHIVTKTRRRNKGRLQYEKLSNGELSNRQTIVEQNCKLEINLHDYLDTGIFLDHRPLRKRIAADIKGKSFLNLFCYTATASVQAAVAGAESSVSVDMSNTYLEWAKRNFLKNGVSLAQHKLERANCVDWLKQCRQGFDVIMLDPPSFSNSKKMDNVLDIQKDHPALINRAMELLKPGGTLYFSTNLRSFKLDKSALCKVSIEHITHQTLDPDFESNPKIHHCWKFQGDT